MQRESISRQTFVKGIAAGAVVAASLGTLNLTEYSTADKAKKHDFVPGTYSSSAKGMESDVKVTITVDEKSITDVNVDVSGETAGIGAEIGDTVKAQILDAQNSMIDGVAGATVSTTAVKEALDAAIAKAEAGEADPETEAVTEAVEEAAGEEPITEGALQEPASEETAAGYVPGAYSASAAGMESDVTVAVIVDEASITDVAIDVSGETAGIGAEIGATVKEQILAAQGPEIEGVAGATISSNAVKAALTDALAQAVSGTAEAPTAEAAAAETAAEAAPAAETAGSGYVPGTYSASAFGMESDVKVDVTVDEASITDVAIDVSGETPGIGAEIGDTVREQILAAQGPEIEGVAGATVSTTAVKTALTDALAQASVGAASAEEAPAAEAVTEAADEIPAEEAASEAAEEAAPTAEAVTEAAEEVAPTAEAVAEEVPTAAASGYIPGTYTGSAFGMESDVTVAVTVSDSKILAAGVNASGETPEIGGAAGPELAKQILAAQGAGIDGVAGATITSDAAKAAVTDALAKAVAGSVDETPAAEAVTEAAEETPAEEAAAEAVTEAAEKAPAAEAVTEAAEEAPVAEAVTAAAEEAPAAAASGYVPGTYTASAAGLESDVTVALTVSDSKITAVGVNTSGETPEIGGAACPELTKQILAAQGTGFDGVAGATITSDAVRVAVADALAAAVSGTASSEEAPAAEAATEADAEAPAAEAVTEAAQEVPAAPASGYVPGTYTGSAFGMESDVTVAVTVTDSKIAAVGVNTSGETPEIGGAAGPELASQILAAQGAEFDGVAGATITSDAARAAVADALAAAIAGSADLEEAESVPGTVAIEEETAADEAEAATEAAADEAEAAGEEVEAATEAAGEAESLASGNYKPGTYVASALGMESDVTISITFDESRIVAVAINVSKETPEIGATAGPELVSQILAAQSAQIDGVAGATITSQAAATAAADCIAQASE